jgi:hypothetical protein
VVIVLGCASSPFGFGVFGSAVATRDASSAVITEWAPLWETPTEGVATWVAAAIATVLTAAAWQRRPQDRLLPVWTGAVVVLLLGGVDAARFSAMALVLAMPAAAVWATDVDWNGSRNRWRLAFVARGVAAGFAVVLLVVSVVRLPDFGRPAPARYPTDATVQAIPAGCRVLNEYNDGGYLILRRSADDVRVALDGRNDVYGATLIIHLQALIHGYPGALAELADDGVRCLLLNPDRPLVKQALAAGWRERAKDPKRVLLIR